MWKHEIISDFQQHALNDSIHQGLYFDVISQLDYAQNIHLGDVSFAVDGVVKLEKAGRDLFVEGNGEHILFPFTSTLFTFTCEKLKLAALLKQMCGSSIVFGYCVIQRPSIGHWILLPCMYYRENGNEKIGYYAVPPDEKERKQLNMLQVLILRAIHSFMEIINARNVYLELVEPPNRLNKKRLKKGKIPIFRHHILKVAVGPVRKKSDYTSIAPVAGAMPVHLCRGHFRYVSEEKPMFGRSGCYGRFWIPAHVRGNKKNGILTKDYLIKP